MPLDLKSVKTRRMLLAVLIIGLFGAIQAFSGIDVGMPSAVGRRAKQLNAKDQAQQQQSQSPNPAPVPSFVLVTEPSGSHVYTTQSSSIAVGGYYSGMASLQWSNNRGGSGAITAADQWISAGISLQPADNAITVTGTNFSGNQSTDTITITYNPNLDFLSYALADPNELFVNQSTNVLFSISIDTNSGALVAGSVEVHQTDSNGNITDQAPFPETLYDDGTHGDIVANDSTYTAVVSLTETSTGTYYFRISAQTGSGSAAATADSEVFSVSAFNEITPAQGQASLDLLTGLENQYAGFETSYSAKQAQTMALSWLQAQAGVAATGLTEDSSGIWLVTDAGIAEIFLTGPSGTQGGASSLASKEKAAINEAATATFSIQIDTADLISFFPESIQIHEMNRKNGHYVDQAPFPLTLYDDGTHGDKRAHDGTFTAKVPLINASTGPIINSGLHNLYEITARTKGNGIDMPLFYLAKLRSINRAQEKEAKALLNRLGGQWPTLERPGLPRRFTSRYGERKIDRPVEWLGKQPHVVGADRLEELYGIFIWFEMDSGLYEKYQVPTWLAPENEGGAGPVSPLRPPPLASTELSLNHRSLQLKARRAKPSSIISPGNNSGGFFYGFFAASGYEFNIAPLGGIGYNVTPYRDFTTSTIKNMTGEGVIVIHTHGDVLPDAAALNNAYIGGPGLQVQVSPNCAQSLAKAVIFVTRETTAPSTLTEDPNYSACKKLLAKVPGDPNTYVGITPAFIDAYIGSLPNSVVYAGACGSLANSATMAEAFLRKGAKAYFGFTPQVVHLPFDYENFTSVFSNLVDGQSGGAAFSDALIKYPYDAHNTTGDCCWTDYLGLVPAGQGNQAYLFGSTLEVTTIGNGTVTVTPQSSVTTTCPTVNAASACTDTFPVGTKIKLTATAAGGSEFAGWSGGDCSGTGATCTLTLSAAQSVTAAFNASAGSNALTVSLAGTGSGGVVSSPSGINCGSACSASYAFGTQVTLTATANSGSTFAGWSGSGCSGTGACTITMNAAQSVTATFNPTNNAFSYLEVDLVSAGTFNAPNGYGFGGGAVTSSPPGISVCLVNNDPSVSCTGAFQAAFPSGSQVTLTAAPSSYNCAGYTGGVSWVNNSGCGGSLTYSFTLAVSSATQHISPVFGCCP